MIYQIRVKGHLVSQPWTDWFQELTITLEENGDMILTGSIADQSALHGLLKKVRDLGMPLLAVNCLDPNQANMIGDEQLNDSFQDRQAKVSCTG